eukprot:jgi/Phyca11/550812/estExt2_Genewise1Plus.C_PHYCAscaffold_390009
MRTAFSDSQDKKLVQLASVYERRGVRITWKDVHMRMRYLFACVRKVDVRQKPGQRHLNAGELLPAGVDKLIKTLGDVEASDSFLDIGCGLGNVTMQFALQTPAKSCLGIEIRPDIFHYGWRLIQNSVEHQRHLKKKPFSTATIVLANNRLFEETAKLKIQEQLGIHSYARIVVFGENVCPRHQPSCRHLFCTKWYVWKVIRVLVSWTSSAELWIYKRQVGGGYLT